MKLFALNRVNTLIALIIVYFLFVVVMYYKTSVKEGNQNSLQGMLEDLITVEDFSSDLRPMEL